MSSQAFLSEEAAIASHCKADAKLQEALFRLMPAAIEPFGTNFGIRFAEFPRTENSRVIPIQRWKRSRLKKYA